MRLTIETPLTRCRDQSCDIPRYQKNNFSHMTEVIKLINNCNHVISDYEIVCSWDCK